MKYKSKDNKTNIKVDLSLCFDNDFNVYSISKTINIAASECKNRNETRINPITKQQNCGFWSIETECIETYDLKEALEKILNKIEGSIAEIKKILIDNNGVAIFHIVPTIKKNRVPALYFERKFLDAVDMLNAEIDIDIYIV